MALFGKKKKEGAENSAEIKETEVVEKATEKKVDKKTDKKNEVKKEVSTPKLSVSRNLASIAEASEKTVLFVKSE